jgi:hypothetical protein
LVIKNNARRGFLVLGSNEKIIIIIDPGGTRSWTAYEYSMRKKCVDLKMRRI